MFQLFYKKIYKAYFVAQSLKSSGILGTWGKEVAVETTKKQRESQSVDRQMPGRAEGGITDRRHNLSPEEYREVL